MYVQIKERAKPPDPFPALVPQQLHISGLGTTQSKEIYSQNQKNSTISQFGDIYTVANVGRSDKSWSWRLKNKVLCLWDVYILKAWRFSFEKQMKKVNIKIHVVCVREGHTMKSSCQLSDFEYLRWNLITDLGRYTTYLSIELQIVEIQG